jgi:type I restriction-modification system DNA methylase subunit
MRHFKAQDEYEKEFEKIMDKLTYNRMKWEVWADLIFMMAASISNALEPNPAKREKREKEYMRCVERCGGAELPAQAFCTVVEALEQNPDQDFLGSLYMRFELGSHWHGQFFTPYSLCHLMADIQMDDLKGKIDREGWVSVCDPCIGGGAMMVAAASKARTMGINYQKSMLFVGQDVDRIAGMMAYIQMSLLGMPGYVVIADTLSNPMTGDVLIPDEKEGQEYWYTPFFYRDEWSIRKVGRMLELMARAGKPAIEPEPARKYTFFFTFGEEEANERQSYQQASGRIENSETEVGCQAGH